MTSTYDSRLMRARRRRAQRRQQLHEEWTLAQPYVLAGLILVGAGCAWWLCLLAGLV